MYLPPIVLVNYVYHVQDILITTKKWHIIKLKKKKKDYWPSSLLWLFVKPDKLVIVVITGIVGKLTFMSLMTLFPTTHALFLAVTSSSSPSLILSHLSFSSSAFFCKMPIAHMQLIKFIYIQALLPYCRDSLPIAILLIEFLVGHLSRDNLSLEFGSFENFVICP